MKKCPKCAKVYDESWTTCLECRETLVPHSEDRLTRLENQARQILKEIADIRAGKTSATAASQPAGKAHPAPEPAAGRENTETQIGKYILNKIGVASIVAGVAFFIAYTFQYLAPVYKIAIGYAIAGALICFGLRIEKHLRYRWYGRGLIGGGWLLTYFTTFAMYHVPVTRIIASQSIDLILLAGVIAGMILHLRRYNSQGVFATILTLGYLTAGISERASFAFIYLALLALVVIFLLMKTRWHKLALFSVLGTYITHATWINIHNYLTNTAAGGLSNFWIAVSFAGVYWVLYSIIPLVVESDSEKDRNALRLFVMANCALFAMTIFLEIRGFDHASGFSLYNAAALIIAVLGLAMLRMKGKMYLATPYFLMAAAFVTLGLHFKLTRHLTAILWFAEVPLLILIGMIRKRALYRLGGAALALIALGKITVVHGVGLDRLSIGAGEIPWALLILLASVTAFLLARYLYIVYRAQTEKWEFDLAHIYTITAALIALWLTYYEIDARLVTLSWAALALMLFLTGFMLRDQVCRYLGIGVIGLATLRVLAVDMAGANTLARITVFIALGLMLLAVSYWYTRLAGTAEKAHEPLSSGAVTGVPLIFGAFALTILALAYTHPSNFRNDQILLQKEKTITARFLSGDTLNADEAAFLRGRECKELIAALNALPLEKETDVAYRLYKRAFEMGVSSPVLYRRMGNFYLSRKDAPRAIGWLEKTVAADPEFKKYETRFVTRSLGKLYMDRGDYAKAVHYYTIYVRYYPYAVSDAFNLAECHKKLGNYDKALEVLNKVLENAPDSPYISDIYSSRADIWSKKGMVTEAEADLKKSEKSKTTKEKSA